MSNMSVEEQINSLKNLSTALGVLDKLPQHLVKDAMNNVIPSVIFALQQQEVLVNCLLDLKHNNHHTIQEEIWRIDKVLAPYQWKG